MKAKVVVGLGWGDEGKGITTDYLTSKLPDSIVVRYCGGHQAGHTVVKDDIRHVFTSYGSGTLRGAETYISEHCCFYPPFMKREHDVLLDKLWKSPKLTIHPLAKLTTPFDIAFNRILERRNNHGSVGVGIGATMSRNQGPHKLHAVDTTNLRILNQKMGKIQDYYTSQLIGSEHKEFREIADFELRFFLDSIEDLDVYITSYEYLRNFQYIIFEGAQGILLDMDFGIYPNVTFANTTSRNAIEICNKLGITNIDIYYVTRCYLTRHGNGFIPNNKSIELIDNEHETNVFNEWQGEFKIHELDYELLQYAISCDNAYSYDSDKHLVMTCLDQRPSFTPNFSKIGEFSSIIGSYSSDSKDFRIIYAH